MKSLVPKYVLQRKEDGKYVAISGNHESYVKNGCKVRFFDTEEQAEKNKCGNEKVIKVHPQLCM